MRNWYQAPCVTPCAKNRLAAQQHQLQLTKPPGSLGQLEHIAVDFAGWQRRAIPALENIAVRVFAADHGICAQGVSAFPAEVTAQMIGNFVNGGAAISALARRLQADFAVVNMGTSTTIAPASGLIDMSVAPGTRDFSREEAMDANLLQACLLAGRDLVDALDCELFIAGEMGIGNTSAASAITAALLNLEAESVVGRGTGIDDSGLQRKRQAIAVALDLHRSAMKSAEDVLRCVGGFEIAAMTGAYIRCTQRGIPILLDGFISGAAALLAQRLNPGVTSWMIAGHRSTEPAHHHVLEALELRPLLELDMRLGEGSGAAVAADIICAALVLHREMATFDRAGVSKGDER